MGKSGFNREICIALLRDKQASLAAQGPGRYPRRSDFGDDEVAAVKAFLGAWPRALEAAGLKPCRDDGKAQRNLEKRIRAKRRKTAAIKKAATKRGGSIGG